MSNPDGMARRCRLPNDEFDPARTIIKCLTLWVDLSLRNVPAARRDPRETEADEWAENGLIPEDIWNTSKVKDNPTPLAVMELAQRLGIHPAIIAGRIRYETRNFRLLSHFVGTGTLRKQFLKNESDG